jgi:hypothetical protein
MLIGAKDLMLVIFKILTTPQNVALTNVVA